MVGQFAALEAQVEALNAQLQKTAIVANGVNPEGFQKMQRMVGQSSQVYRAAANSTGMWAAEQIRVKSATDEYTKALERQKLSFRDLIKNQKVARSAYREQLALQNMVVRALPGRTGGKQLLDIAVPTEVSRDLDTIGNQIGWIREQVRSASTQMINWGKNTQWAGRQLMVGFTLPVAAFGAATGALAYQIDQQLTRIQKVYDTTADQTSTDVKQMAAVEQELMHVREQGLKTARLAAEQYAASANDTLSVQAELAATGKRGQALQETTAEVMRVATLGEMDYNTALQSTIALQSVFRMSNDELSDSFNYMNAVENATSLQLQDFATAIPIAAAPIKAMGGDVQDLGVLLTAMKERGIEASQGANAIKAAMQRLYRPSKQIQEEFAAITGANILDIRDESGGNLIEMLQRIRDVTKDLSNTERIQVFAGLFGTYQVTRMSALIEGMGDLEKGVGQVSDAYRLASQDSATWAAAADREMARLQESASQKFKSAVETLKIELAEMGEPFLAIGSEIVKAIAGIVKAFNSMPDWVKYLVAGGAAFMALVGPIVMLTGLFANFTGNMLKFGVAITGILTKFELLNKESAAARIAAGLAEQGFANEATQVQILTAALEKLTLAEARAAQAARTARFNDLLSSGMTRQQAAHQLASERREYLVQSGAAVKTADGKGVQNSNYIARSAEQIAKDSEVTKRNWGGIAANMGVAAAAGVTMLGTSDGTLNNIAEMVLYASLLTPLFSGAGSAIKAMKAAEVGSIISTKWAAGMEKTRASAASASASAKTFGRNLKAAPIKTMAGGLKSGAASLAGMIPVAGWVGLAVAAIGVSAYAIWKHNKAVTEEMHAQAKAVASTNNLLKDQLDIQIKARQTLSTPSASRLSNGVTPSDLASELKDSSSGSDLIDAMNENDGRDAQTIAMKKYIDVLDSVGGTAEKARTYVEALFIASGDGALEAQRKALQMYQALGGIISETEKASVWTQQIEMIRSQNFQKVEDMGTDLGKAFANNLARAADGDEKNRIFETFASTVETNWEGVMENMDSRAQEVLGQVGITTGDQFKNMVDQWQKVVDHEMSQSQFLEMFNLDDKDLNQGYVSGLLGELNQTYERTAGEADNLRNTEKAIVEELKNQLGITDDITTLAELRNTWEWQLQTATKANAGALYEQRAAAIETANSYLGIFGASEDVLDNQKLQVLNQIRLALGMRETGNLADGFGRATMDINGNMIEQGRTTDANTRKLERQKFVAQQIAAITGAQVMDLAKNAMGSFQQGIADATMDDFENSWSDRMDSIEADGERRMENFDNNAERAQNKLERNQERRRKEIENSYNSRIKAIQKEIDAEQKADEARQRMFEREKERLDRLAQTENSNIDFNMALNEGNLDEAAKIRNDMAAQAAEWALTDANDRASRQSERKQNRLEKRIDSIEKLRDKELDRLSKLEERERKSLERRQDRERKAIQASIEATQKAEQEKYETRKKYLEDSLDDFTGYIATSDKDLRKHIRIWEKEHKGLSLTTQGQFETTSDNINDYIVESVKGARRELVNSNMWETGGQEIAKKMIRGAFGLNMNQFKRWMVTGKWPEQDKNKKNESPYPTYENKPHVYHTGGVVGKDRGGYAGFARGHRDEVNATLLKGEGVLNRRAMDSLGERGFRDLNNGRHSAQPMGGAGTGFAGIMMGALAASMKSAVGNAVEVGAAEGRRKQQAIAGYKAGKAGLYGDVKFSAEQLHNAATIASVGKNMGMSARDIQIGIMTAITESMLRNVDYGDRDSLGLFQQRPSQGWGSPAQVTTPEYAARKFFEALRGVSDRGRMSPWAAAQAVQRSAYADGSNYRPYWDEAKDIFKFGLGTVSGAPMGPGGGHRPINKAVTNGLHDTSTGFPAVDFATPTGTPVYAVGDGIVTRSEDIAGPLPSDRYRGDGPYGSYGRVMQLRLNGGPEVLYAHLSKRNFNRGAHVTGGTVLGLSGNTGNSSGDHLHFGSSDGNPYQFVSLKKGSANIKKDDVKANLHKNEAVLTEDQNQQMKSGVKAVFETPTVLNQLLAALGNAPNVGSGTDLSGNSVSPSSSDSAAGLRTGTYNVLFASSNERTKGDLTKLMQMADTLALTEYTAPKQALTPWIKSQGWGVAGPGGAGKDSAIIYNRDKYDLRGQRIVKMNEMLGRGLDGQIGSGGARQRYATAAHLMDKETGRDFWQIAAHTIAHVWKDPKRNRAVQQEQYRTLGNLAKELGADGTPVFVAGDLNNDPRNINGPKARGSRFFTPLGLKDNWNKQNMNGNYTIGRSYLDHVFYDPRMAQLLSQKVIRGLTSDHNALLTNFKLPAFANGGYTLSDGLAMLHKKETVLSAPLTEQLHAGMKNFANGGNTTYNFNMSMGAQQYSLQALARELWRLAKAEESRKPQSRTAR